MLVKLSRVIVNLFSDSSELKNSFIASILLDSTVFILPFSLLLFNCANANAIVGCLTNKTIVFISTPNANIVVIVDNELLLRPNFFDNLSLALSVIAVIKADITNCFLCKLGFSLPVLGSIVYFIPKLS